jgi:uncharacterized membrane protein
MVQKDKRETAIVFGIGLGLGCCSFVSEILYLLLFAIREFLNH